MSVETIRYLVLFVSLGLLMLMQIGFLCLESGVVRSKNSINVAAKNLLDLLMVMLLFWFFGYSIMFGESSSGLFGQIAPFSTSKDDLFRPLFFLFQAMFAATAATIVSGSIAERCSLKGYLVIVMVMTMAIYPVVGHWVWGGVYSQSSVGWLEKAGFYDFAGSSVVHVTGGVIALVSVKIIGPRTGFEKALTDGFTGHSMVMAILGYLFLWLGWFGFNGGSVVLTDFHQLPQVLMNTAIAGAAGGFGVLALELAKSDKLDILMLANGIIAGLVSVTAGCNIFSATASVVVGLCGGLLFFIAKRFFDWLKVDDPVRGIPVHLIGGIWGAMAVALFANTDAIPSSLSRIQWLLVQFEGVLAIVAWGGVVGWTLLSIINRFIPLRVSRDGEKAGLNFTEHGARTELYDLLQDMKHQQLSGDFSGQVRIEPHTEIGQVAFQYNQVTRSFNAAQDELYETIDNLERTRQALNDACKEAEKASDYKSAFLANMSHEIRTPINGVIGMAELLLLEDMSSRQQNYIETIHSSARGLINIINDILDYSKIEAGELSLEVLEFDIRQLLQECLDIFRVQAEEKNIELSLQCHLDLDVSVYGDPTRIRQIVINLLSNSLKFTEKGYVCLKADLNNDGNTGSLILSVEDTGVGMTEEQRDRVFTAFQQADNSTARQYGGTGLGLSITQQLVEMMGGTINVTSAVGKGTFFELSIPVGAALDNQIMDTDAKDKGGNRGEESAFSREWGGADRWLSSVCIDVLVAEDNRVNQMVIRKYLEKLGITGHILENGKQIVEYCEKHTPQLILMDCEMPEMDGLTATRFIREQGGHELQPIIIGLSAHAMKNHEEKGFAAGMDWYLTKPVTLEQLQSAILQFFSSVPSQ